MMHETCTFLKYIEKWLNKFVLFMCLFLNFLARDPEVRLPALPDFMRSGVSGNGSTKPRVYNWRST
jgi:hypothetical protein